MASQNSLKNKISVTGVDDTSDIEAIARAEKALAELSVEFDDWLIEEVTRLLAARDAVKSGADSYDELYRAAHDLKGEGATLGYPVVSELSVLLCKLMDAAEDKSAIPLTLIDNHVDAIHIVMRDKIKDTGQDTVRAVIDRLGEVVEDYEAHFARRKAS